MARLKAKATSVNPTEAARAMQAEHVARVQSESRHKKPKVRKVLVDVLDFRNVYRSSSADRIQIIKAGVSAKKVYGLASKLGISQDVMIKRLGLSKSTVSRKAQADDTLSADQGERVLGMSKLIGLVQTIVDESGDPDAAQDFDAASWLEAWLSQPNPALGGVPPSTYLDTHEGLELLGTLIAQMQSGAYA